MSTTWRDVLGFHATAQPWHSRRLKDEVVLHDLCRDTRMHAALRPGCAGALSRNVTPAFAHAVGS